MSDEKRVSTVTIEHELKQSYLDYAMSVIVGRALPDVRDGLKPVHRRVLFAMNVLNNDYNKPHKKSARIVGDVIGKYHPHGDTAVYDTIVRMAQDFSMRYMLVDGQGNFGSIDGDSAAAMRYTEIRLSRVAHALMLDLEKETVDFSPNYDETEMAPTVLPTRVPNLLVNGSSGIAVGMATNIPPHNLGEVVNACLAMIDNSEITLAELMEYLPGPDFPTAGIINGRSGIVEAYRTGRGRIYVRARADIESKADKEAIIIHELPYQVNKAKLLEKIGELVKEKRLQGITAIRDESDKDGMRVVIEVRRGENAEVLLNRLYNETQMQTVFGINMVALDNGQPKILNLHQILDAFIKHRREVVTRRTIFELRKAKERAHILEGLSIALANIDEMIRLIKSSSGPAEAKEKLLAKRWPMGFVADLLERAGDALAPSDELEEPYGFIEGEYQLSSIQVQAILELRLHRLTGLEQDKITGEYKGLIDLIGELMEILQNPIRLMAVIREELEAVKKDFNDQRRTEISGNTENLQEEDLIPKEKVVVTLSHAGYMKNQELDGYQAQRRGGRGKAAANMKEEDYIDTLLVTHSHDMLLCFSNRGKIYWMKAYQVPRATRTARGRPVINLLPLQEGEKIQAIMSVTEFSDDHFVFMATQKGTVKKVPLSAFSRPRNGGIIALDMVDDDVLVDVALTDGVQNIMLFSDAGKVIQFPESAVRPMGRTARGVRGMKLKEDQKLISLVIVRPEGAILTATENGYGKRTPIEEYRTTGRGGQGVISIQVSERNGKVVDAIQVVEDDEMMLITDGGTLVRTRVSEISQVGRNTQGVRLIQCSKGEALMGVQRIEMLDVDMSDESIEIADSNALTETTDPKESSEIMEE